MVLLLTRRADPLFLQGRPLNISLAITPADDTELVTNGNMETGDPPTGWLAAGSATLDGVADERTGGAGAQSISVVNGGADTGSTYRTITNAANRWARLSLWGRKVTGTSSYAYVIQNDAPFAEQFRIAGFTSASWANYVATGLITVVNCIAQGYNAQSTLGHEARFDDVSVMSLTHASLFSEPYDAGRKTRLRVISRPTLTARTQCGHIVCALPGLTYYLMAYHDGTNAALRKYENGTYTSLISAAATYAAGAKLETRVTGILSSATVQLWYNGSQVGADQSVDLSSYGSQIRGFSTLSSNKVGSLVLEYT